MNLVKASEPHLSPDEKLFQLFLYYSKQGRAKNRLFSDIQDENAVISLQLFLLLAKEVISKAAKIAPKRILEIFKKSVKR